jgi:nucleoid DNA-binding protein
VSATVLTKEELIEYLVETFGFQRVQAIKIYDGIFGKMAQRLHEGGKVRLPKVGTLHRGELKATNVRHPVTGELMRLPKRYRFKLNSEPFPAEETKVLTDT